MPLCPQQPLTPSPGDCRPQTSPLCLEGEGGMEGGKTEGGMEGGGALSKISDALPSEQVALPSLLPHTPCCAHCSPGAAFPSVSACPP